MGTQPLGTPPPFFLAPTLLHSRLTHIVLEPLTRAALESCQAFSAAMGPILAPQPSLSSLSREMAHLVPMGPSFPSLTHSLELARGDHSPAQRHFPLDLGNTSTFTIVLPGSSEE